MIVAVVLSILFNSRNKSNKQLVETNLKLQEANNKLNISESSLKELNSVKDKFFSIITHDLRGPLSTLKMLLINYMENTEAFTKEEMISFTKKILDSTDNVSCLFENLLIWSKTETNNVIYKPEELNLAEITEQTLKLFKLRLIQKEINISINVDGNILVFADKNMLSFVLRNLIDNAIKYTEKDGKIEVNAANIEDNFIKISVNDNGIGIEQKNLNNLFQINTHFSSGGTQNEKGTGLGLIICKEFIEKNNGKIWVESKQGIGSSFYFTLLNG
ncbi:MAG: HAMP domain-containing histidine kinase [Bacteroidetes bacterium]|nr:HAMP domain-containing histidine kinase [Bacteroidota bacterium]